MPFWACCNPTPVGRWVQHSYFLPPPHSGTGKRIGKVVRKLEIRDSLLGQAEVVHARKVKQRILHFFLSAHSCLVTSRKAGFMTNNSFFSRQNAISPDILPFLLHQPWHPQPILSLKLWVFRPVILLAAFRTTWFLCWTASAKLPQERWGKYGIFTFRASV